MEDSSVEWLTGTNPASPSLYIWGSSDKLKAYRLTGGVFDTTPAIGEYSTGSVRHRSDRLCKWRNGRIRNRLGKLLPVPFPSVFKPLPGQLFMRSMHPTYPSSCGNSEQNSGRDLVGANFAKFAAPDRGQREGVHSHIFQTSWRYMASCRLRPQSISPNIRPQLALLKSSSSVRILRPIFTVTPGVGNRFWLTGFTPRRASVFPRSRPCPVTANQHGEQQPTGYRPRSR